MPEKTCYYTSASAESSKAQLNMDSNGYQYTIFGKGPWETNYAVRLPRIHSDVRVHGIQAMHNQDKQGTSYVQSVYPGYIMKQGSMVYKLYSARVHRIQAMII